MRRVLPLFFVFAFSAAAASRGCVGSVAVSSFRITVQRSGDPAALPVRNINNISAGYRLGYQPVDLPPDLKKDGKLTFVMVPKSPAGQVTVLEPEAAAGQAQWRVPFDTGIVVLVLAPQGLDEKRLTNLVTKEQALVNALADYADETADLESALEQATELEDDADDARQIRGSTPAEQALVALARALNPAISSYNPLGAGRRAGSATLMGRGAEAFFDNAGGFVPGGGILPSVKSWLMPDTEFRSVYSVPAESNGMTLCAQIQPKSRNKIAYLWAHRLTGVDAPAASMLKDVDAPIGMRGSVPVKLSGSGDWRLIDHVFDWTLVPASGSAPSVAVTVRLRPNENALSLDLRKFAGAPGAYRIQGKWDWDTFKLAGVVRLHKLDDLKAAQPTPDSLDRLISNTGPVSLDLRGADFLFVDRAWLHRPNTARQLPVDLPAEQSGPSDQLRVNVDTDSLRPGKYLLALSRVDGAVTDIPLQVLLPAPKLDAPGPRVNIGEREQVVTFLGTGLDRIESLYCDQADITLQPASEDGTRRSAKIVLHAGAKAGDRLALSGKVEGMAEPVHFHVALQVAAARPRILDAKVSLANDLVVALRDGEIPAGSWVSYALRVEPANVNSSLTLECVDPASTVQPIKLHVGEKQANAQLIQAGNGIWFLSLDPGAAGQSGCTLTAVVDSEDLGKSDSFALGKVIRTPRIESFSMTGEKSPEGFYGVLKGFDLETIEKTGWDNQSGVAVTGLPRAVGGEGAKQSLQISMPWPAPSPKAPLFVWLRGETEGRATKVTP